MNILPIYKVYLGAIKLGEIYYSKGFSPAWGVERLL